MIHVQPSHGERPGAVVGGCSNIVRADERLTAFDRRSEFQDNEAMGPVARSLVTAALVIGVMRTAHGAPDTSTARADDRTPRAGEGGGERDAVQLVGGHARRRPWRALPLTMVALGGTAIAGGITILAMNDDPTPMNPDYVRDTATTGLVTIAGGSVLAGIGGYLYWRYGRAHAGEIYADGDRSWIAPASLMAGGVTLVVVGTIWMQSTEPPDTFEQPRYLFNVPAGATIAAGGVAVCLGAYLGFKDPKLRSAPMVSLSGHGGVIGWTGTY
jgi:hypothetical protein